MPSTRRRFDLVPAVPLPEEALKEIAALSFFTYLDALGFPQPGTAAGWVVLK